MRFEEYDTYSVALATFSLVTRQDLMQVVLIMLGRPKFVLANAAIDRITETIQHFFARSMEGFVEMLGERPQITLGTDEQHENHIET